ncbi:MAG: hypothetical protein H0U08_06455, partial [Actinobacteria bacterium]|nr:hypothetical protein [Actinomycetota bacterium]
MAPRDKDAESVHIEVHMGATEDAVSGRPAPHLDMVARSGGRADSPPQLPDLDFEAMTAEEVIAWTHRFFWPRVCLTCSWQKQSSVLVHMVAEMGLR